MTSQGPQPPTVPSEARDSVNLLFGGGFGQRPAQPAAPPRPRRGRRIAAIVGAVAFLLLGGLFVLSESLGNNVQRVPNVFGPIDANTRPAASEALTFLVVGTDSRFNGPITGTNAASSLDAAAQRSDVFMVARITPDRTQADVVSIRRDSWVDIPGRGMDRINAAYMFGGPSLLVQTVENLTKLRIDHFAVIDFAGFQSMVDSVGGIDVDISAASSNAGVNFRQGVNQLDGAAASAYVAQRPGLPEGDPTRAERQQNALRALLSKAVSGGTATNPVGLYNLLDATSRSISVDDTMTNSDIRWLAFEMRGLRPAEVRFLRTPTRGAGQEGAQLVVYLDATRSTELWDALATGSAASYQQRYPMDALGAGPR